MMRKQRSRATTKENLLADLSRKLKEIGEGTKKKPSTPLGDSLITKNIQETIMKLRDAQHLFECERCHKKWFGMKQKRHYTRFPPICPRCHGSQTHVVELE